MLAKTKFSAKELLISKALIDFNVIHDEIVSVNNMLMEYIHEMTWKKQDYWFIKYVDMVDIIKEMLIS